MVSQYPAQISLHCFIPFIESFFVNSYPLDLNVYIGHSNTYNYHISTVLVFLFFNTHILYIEPV